MKPPLEGSALLPCPFCGGLVTLEKTHQSRDRIHGERQWWGIKCRNTVNLGGTCGVEAVPTASPEAAIGRWNRRATPTEPVVPSSWISVDDRMPLEHDLVIVDGGVARWRRGEWITETGRAAGKPILWRVTHWMSLPKAPKEPVAPIETAGSSLADPLSPRDRKLVDGVLDDLAGLISGTSGTGGPSGLA